MTWGHARPGGILVGEWPDGKRKAYSADRGANTIGSILKNLRAQSYYNLGCNTYSKLNGDGSAEGKKFFDQIAITSGQIPMFGTVGYDNPGKTLSDEIDDKPPKWYMEPGGKVVRYGPPSPPPVNYWKYGEPGR